MSYNFPKRLNNQKQAEVNAIIVTYSRAKIKVSPSN
jgi:hypothetical protein